MSENKKAQVDTETILITLDQIGQTIDIMTGVVGRLRGYITEQSMEKETSEQHSLNQTNSHSHTLH